MPRGGKRADGSPNLLERVEARYPGTTEWLFSRLWRLADRAPMDMTEIRQIYEGMPNLIRSIFVAPKTKTQGLFWRRPVDIDHACEILLRLRNVDGLIALLAMMREAETTQDQEQHYVAAEAVNRHLTELSATHEIIGSGLGASLHRYLRESLARPGYFDVPNECR
ncbi:hypothetical protein GALL_203410 [mine drainage metagenome]|uniref:Uncharacterized protein n=1 Tax=mine drainage metagenome TaxID=410659 RepID=A0A1J5RNF7_9ZZZZ